MVAGDNVCVGGSSSELPPDSGTGLKGLSLGEHPCGLGGPSTMCLLRYLVQSLSHKTGVLFLFPSSHSSCDEPRRRLGTVTQIILGHVGP